MHYYVAYNDINNIDFKQDCVHIRKYINRRMAKYFNMCAIVKMERPDFAPAMMLKFNVASQHLRLLSDHSLCWESCCQKINIFFQKMWKDIVINLLSLSYITTLTSRQLYLCFAGQLCYVKRPPEKLDRPPTAKKSKSPPQPAKRTLVGASAHVADHCHIVVSLKFNSAAYNM